MQILLGSCHPWEVELLEDTESGQDLVRVPPLGTFMAHSPFEKRSGGNGKRGEIGLPIHWFCPWVKRTWDVLIGSCWRPATSGAAGEQLCSGSEEEEVGGGRSREWGWLSCST